MPRYFFHLRNDLDVEDEEGQELPDLDAARLRAFEYAVDMSANSIVEHRKVNLSHSIEVANEAGQVLLSVPFGDVITVHR